MVQKFGERLKFFAEKVFEHKQGMFPFDYEKGEDYWPEMNPLEMKQFKKDKKLALNNKRALGVTK